MQDTVRIVLFGGLQIHHEEQVFSHFPTYRARALLAFLAFHREQPHPREFLAEMLWPGGHPDAIRLRLNQTVAEIRKALKPVDTVLRSDRFFLSLNPSVATDVADFLDLIRSAKQTTDLTQKRLLLTRAEAMARMPFLAGHKENTP
ncbi:MAG TPA: hypothetical protein VKU00_30880 [Chthonomonadaceae bacterium]|nr:hypothetical protein [Chthonomonadaceae bacterium]